MAKVGSVGVHFGPKGLYLRSSQDRWQLRAGSRLGSSLYMCVWMLAAGARVGVLVRLRISARGCSVRARNALLPLGCEMKVRRG